MLNIIRTFSFKYAILHIFKMNSATIVLVILIMLLVAVLIFTFLRRRPSDKRVVYWNRKKLQDIENKSTPAPIAAKELAHFHKALLNAIESNIDLDDIARETLGIPIPETYETWGVPEDSSWAHTKYKRPFLPDWGDTHTFCVKDVSAFETTPPDPTSDIYQRDYEELLLLGGKHSAVRTEDQTEGARFWDLGEGSITLPGMWNLIAGNIIESTNMSELEIAKSFVNLNYALSDTGVVTWSTKNGHMCPVTAFRAEIEPNWTPLLDTPSFPTSVHSSFSGAAATVLSHFLPNGELCVEYRGIKRCFTSFQDAMRDAGRSRIYGGVTWEFDNLSGCDMGAAIGNQIISMDAKGIVT